MITIYHNPRCSKSREGLAILENSKFDFKIINYLKTPPTVKELTEIIKKLKMKPSDLIRKKEVLWKEKYKGTAYSDAELIEIMVENPKLIERPIVVKDELAILGRPSGNIITLLQ